MSIDLSLPASSRLTREPALNLKELEVPARQLSLFDLVGIEDANQTPVDGENPPASIPKKTTKSEFRKRSPRAKPEPTPGLFDDFPLLPENKPGGSSPIPVQNIAELKNHIGMPNLNPNTVQFIPEQVQFICANAKRDHSPLVQAPTGTGKTYLIIMLSDYHLGLGDRVLIMAPTVDLTEQIAGDAVQSLLVDPTAIGIVHGEVDINERKRIYNSPEKILLTATPETIQNDLERKIVNIKRWGFIVMDEVQHCVGNYDGRTVMKEALAHSIRRAGFSASPASTPELRRALEVDLGLEFDDSTEIKMPPQLKRQRVQMVMPSAASLATRTDFKRMGARAIGSIEYYRKNAEPRYLADARVYPQRKPTDSFEFPSQQDTERLRKKVRIIKQYSQPLYGMALRAMHEVMELRELHNNLMKYGSFYFLDAAFRRYSQIAVTFDGKLKEHEVGPELHARKKREDAAQKAKVTRAERTGTKPKRDTLAFRLGPFYADTDVRVTLRQAAQGTPYEHLLNHSAWSEVFKHAFPEKQVSYLSEKQARIAFFDLAERWMVEHLESDYTKEARLFQIVAKEIAADRNCSILVFDDRIRRARFLAERLNDRFAIDGFRAAWACGRRTLEGISMSSKERGAVLKKFANREVRILVVTSFAEEGHNLPGASTGIMLSPTARPIKVIQRAGRLGRGKNRDEILSNVGTIYHLLFADTLEPVIYRRGLDRVERMYHDPAGT